MKMTGSENNGFLADGNAEHPVGGLIPQQRDAYAVYAEFLALSRELSSADQH